MGRRHSRVTENVTRNDRHGGGIRKGEDFFGIDAEGQKATGAAHAYIDAMKNSEELAAYLTEKHAESEGTELQEQSPATAGVLGDGSLSGIASNTASVHGGGISQEWVRNNPFAPSDESISSIYKAQASLNEDDREEYEERAAIMQYDGGLPQAEAEKRALEIILQRRQHQWKASKVM
jgi:hypothetical protein